VSLDARLALARTLILAAGELVVAGRASPDAAATSKGPGDLVTATDFAVERMLRDAIGTAFPDDAIIGEELGGTSAGGFTWLIDPVDGTVNFARRLNYFCISMALLSDRLPVAAWILDPMSGELFSAGPDRVARLNGEPMACAGTEAMQDAVIGLGFSRRHHPSLHGAIVNAVVMAEGEHRRLGAGALCLAHVAAGRLDAYLEPHMNPWDAVGGLYLAACAGAVTGDYIGMGGLQDGALVYAAAPALSSKLLAVLPAPFSGTPLHRENEPRSAGEVASDRMPSPNVETRP
jgi:myo-inositol-1(or 4)-monophosphatase